MLQLFLVHPSSLNFVLTFPKFYRYPPIYASILDYFCHLPDHVTFHSTSSSLSSLADMAIPLSLLVYATRSPRLWLIHAYLHYHVLYLDLWPLWQAFPRPFLYLTIAMYAYWALGLIFYINTKLLRLKSLATNTRLIPLLVNHRSSGWLPDFTESHSVMPDAVTLST